MIDRRTANIVQAAALIGVSKRTIYNWLTAGKIEFARTPTGRIRIFIDTLLKPSKDPRQ